MFTSKYTKVASNFFTFVFGFLQKHNIFGKRNFSFTGKYPKGASTFSPFFLFSSKTRHFGIKKYFVCKYIYKGCKKLFDHFFDCLQKNNILGSRNISFTSKSNKDASIFFTIVLVFFTNTTFWYKGIFHLQVMIQTVQTTFSPFF